MKKIIIAFIISIVGINLQSVAQEAYTDSYTLMNHFCEFKATKDGNCYIEITSYFGESQDKSLSLVLKRDDLQLFVKSLHRANFKFFELKRELSPTYEYKKIWQKMYSSNLNFKTCVSDNLKSLKNPKYKNYKKYTTYYIQDPNNGHTPKIQFNIIGEAGKEKRLFTFRGRKELENMIALLDIEKITKFFNSQVSTDNILNELK